MSVPSGTIIIGSTGPAANKPSAADVPDGYVFYDSDADEYSVAFGGTFFPIGGGGGGGSTEREQLADSTGTSVGNGSTLVISIGAKTVGTDLLDLTDPVHPTVVTTGVYVVTVSIFPADAMTVGGNYDFTLTLDASGEAAAGGMTSSPSTTLEEHPTATASLPYFLPAGAEITIQVTNNDGAAAITFQPFTVIQRIS